MTVLWRFYLTDGTVLGTEVPHGYSAEQAAAFAGLRPDEVERSERVR